MNIHYSTLGGFFVFLTTKQAKYLDKHIEYMCKQFSVERTVKPGRGHAKVRKRTIQHPPIGIDEMAYFVALHELGHVVIGMHAHRLDREALAWEWALRQSLIEPHYSIRQRICSLLVRYLYRGKENNWEFPKEDSPFWQLFRWWEVEDGT